MKQVRQEPGCQLITQIQLLIIYAVKICKQYLQTALPFGDKVPQTPTGALPLEPTLSPDRQGYSPPMKIPGAIAVHSS